LNNTYRNNYSGTVRKCLLRRYVSEQKQTPLLVFLGSSDQDNRVERIFFVVKPKKK